MKKTKNYPTSAYLMMIFYFIMGFILGICIEELIQRLL